MITMNWLNIKRIFKVWLIFVAVGREQKVVIMVASGILDRTTNKNDYWRVGIH